MAHRSEPRFLVLHGLRLKGFAEAAPVAEGAGLDAREAEDHLRALAARPAELLRTVERRGRRIGHISEHVVPSARGGVEPRRAGRPHPEG